MITPLEAVIDRCYRELETAVPYPSSDFQDGRWSMAETILETLNLPLERLPTGDANGNP